MPVTRSTRLTRSTANDLARSQERKTKFLEAVTQRNPIEEVSLMFFEEQARVKKLEAELRVAKLLAAQAFKQMKAWGVDAYLDRANLRRDLSVETELPDFEDVKDSPQPPTAPLLRRSTRQRAASARADTPVPGLRDSIQYPLPPPPVPRINTTSFWQQAAAILPTLFVCPRCNQPSAWNHRC